MSNYDEYPRPISKPKPTTPQDAQRQVEDVELQNVVIAEVDSSDENPTQLIRGFHTKEIRSQFVRKVYSIILGELFVIIIIVAIFMFTSLRDSVYGDRTYLYVSIGLSVVTVVLNVFITCSTTVRRFYPWNLIVLTVYMALFGVILGILSAYYRIESIFVAAGITMAVVLLLTLFSFWTAIDFTKCYMFIFVAAIVLVLFGIASMFVAIFADNSTTYTVRMVYSGLAAVFFSWKLIYDTQLILIGKYKYSLSPEEYILGALFILTDIINLLLTLLEIVGQKR